MGAGDSRVCGGPSQEEVQKFMDLEKDRDAKAAALAGELDSTKQLREKLSAYVCLCT